MTHSSLIINMITTLVVVLAIACNDVVCIKAQAAAGFPSWLGPEERELLRDDSRHNYMPDVVVGDKEKYRTINDALKAYPSTAIDDGKKFLIYVKKGLYREQVTVDAGKPNVFIYGDGIGKTIVTGNRSFAKSNLNDLAKTATFSSEATGFMARYITFRNTAGPEGEQAVAFRSAGDRAALYECSFEGFQDTLYYEKNRQFYRSCIIYGTVDFIFGRGSCLIQDSRIVVRKPLHSQYNTITADGREPPLGNKGLVIHHCTITADKYLWPVRMQVPTFLGRPWSPDALTVVMQSNLSDLIKPEGWADWKPNQMTCEMYEFGNVGVGADTSRRNQNFTRFKVIVNRDEAAKYTVAGLLNGQEWLPETRFPFEKGLYGA